MSISREVEHRDHGRDRPGRHRDAAHPRGARVPGVGAARVRVGAIARAQAAVRGRRGDVRGAAARLLRRARPRDRRRRRSARRGVGAAGGGRRCARRRQLGRVPHGSRRPARDRRGEPRRPALAAEGHRVVPELHDDDPGHRARAAAPRRAHRSHGRVDVPVGVGRGPGRHARARRAVDEARPAAARSSRGRARSARRSSRARCGRSRSRATRSRSRAR